MAGKQKVVVLGSGAAGVTAALAAATGGAQVTLLEAAECFGGTTALSGVGCWVPASRWTRAAGIQDSSEKALEYLQAIALGDVDMPLIKAYLAESDYSFGRVEDTSPVRWQYVPIPDYQADYPGGLAAGRSIEPDRVTVSAETRKVIRQTPYGLPSITFCEELYAGDKLDHEEIFSREAKGILARGRGYVGALIDTLHDLGGITRLGARGTKLTLCDGTVTGVEMGGQKLEGSVILACGGFDRDPALVKAFLRSPVLSPAGPPTLRGDAVRMSMAAGAALGCMSEAWWSPAVKVAGAEIDGAPFYRQLFCECGLPGGIVVDGNGRRFVNEGSNYNDIGRSIQQFDAGEFRFQPIWLICDAERRALHKKLRSAEPDDAIYGVRWDITADSITALAARIEIDSTVLEATIARYNSMVEAGADRDYGRGSHVFDSFAALHLPQRPLGEGPYYALQIEIGALGTKGGPRIDRLGRVLSQESGNPIEGLFAAGNAACSPFGFAYPGAGATIGPAIHFGWMAGETAAAG